MDNQTRKARETVKNMPIKERLEHFWYYHKLHTIIVVSVVLILGVIAYQTLTREKYDLEISYYAILPLGAEETASLEEYLEGYIEDIDGNGEKNVKIHSTTTGGSLDLGSTVQLEQKLLAELTAAVYPAYIFDESFIEKIGANANGSVVESVIDLRDNAEISDMLSLGETSLYWCTRMLYDRESGNEKSVKAYNNAKLAESVILGE